MLKSPIAVIKHSQNLRKLFTEQLVHQYYYTILSGHKSIIGHNDVMERLGGFILNIFTIFIDNVTKLNLIHPIK